MSRARVGSSRRREVRIAPDLKGWSMPEDKTGRGGQARALDRPRQTEVGPRAARTKRCAEARTASTRAVLDIARRKTEHIDIVLGGEVAARRVSTGFERLRFEHCALPELDLDRIDLSTRFVGRRMAAPFIISSM